ncbi:MAG: RNA-binding protein [Chloroflexota bacterium]
MDTKLYVGNLPFTTTEEDLQAMFSQAGTVASVEVIKDRFTGKSKGFAFVQMGSQSDAEKAIAMFNGSSMGNREIRVNVARPREEGGRGESGGRRGDGFGRGQGNRPGGRNRSSGGGGTNRY